MKTNNIAISIIFVGLMIAGAVFLSGGSKSSTDTPSKENVTMVDGKQIVELKAKGGYVPKVSLAKAGIPTILRLETSGTFDCSSSVRIPSMNISKLLPSSGTTDIDLGIQKVRTFQGTCGMGMYPFEIQFE